MFPVVLQFGPITLYTYGLFVAAGFLASLALASRDAIRRGMDPRVFQDLGFVILVSALVGARLFYVLVEWEHFTQNPFQFFQIWKGGLVFYGGFAGAGLGALWYIHRRGLPLWPTGDVLTSVLPLGQALGRLGCFFAGCCYGAECELPWAITFSDPKSLAPLGVALHPTQLYSAVASLGIFAVLWFGVRPRQRFDGQLLGLYLVLYPVARFIVELFRDDPRGALGPLSTSQTLGIPLFLFGLWILWSRRKS